jgi:hypothetical protein
LFAAVVEAEDLVCLKGFIDHEVQEKLICGAQNFNKKFCGGKPAL